MAPTPAKALIGAAVAALSALGTGCGWAPGTWSGTIELEPPPPARAELTAIAVATLESPVKARRGGRVLALLAQPGAVVSKGDALIELEDLALERSKADLRREIAELTAAHAASSVAPAATARGASRALQQAALRQLEEAHKRASEEFQRWTDLFEEGLVARLDFEKQRQEFETLSGRLRDAQAAASQEITTEEPTEPLELRRSRRLLERLQKLPKTYVVESPSDGIVKEMFIAVGESPARGAVVATVSRAAMPRLQAQVATGTAILAIDEACGVPGPLVFTRRDGRIELAAPSPRLRPGDECRLSVSIRK